MKGETDRPMWVQILQDRSLTPTQRIVLQYFAWRQGRNGEAWPAQATIAEELGISQRHVRTVCRELQAKGKIDITWPAGPGRNHSKRYVVISSKSQKTPPASVEEKRKPHSAFGQEKTGTPLPLLDPEKRNPSSRKRGTSVPVAYRKNTYREHIHSDVRAENLAKSPDEDLFGTPIHTSFGGVTPFANGDYFDRFWAEYPRKVARKKCLGIWRSLKLTIEQAERVIEAVRCYKQTDQWQKDDGRFTPHPSTFLNQRRWEDEIPTKPEPKRGDPDWDPTDEEGIAIFRECGVEVKPGPASAEDVERLRRQLGVKCKVVAG